MRKVSLALFLVLLAPATSWAQYNAQSGKSAPTAQESYEDSDGKRRTRVVTDRAPSKDRHGNAAGSGFDLAVDGAFEGQTVAVLHFYTQEGFDFTLPKKALAQKGFSVYRWVNTAPSPKELKKKLKKACQLWLISDSVAHLNADHIKIIKAFFDSGRGVYIWGDNQPYYSDANAVAEALLGTTMSGNVMGDQIVGMTSKKGPGIIQDHLLSTGIEQIYEGVTIATIAPTDDLKPLIYGSSGNLVGAFYDKGGKRAILDGGFTRLYIKWDTAGTGRYVKNSAAWLTNFERFGDDVVGGDLKKVKKKKQLNKRAEKSVSPKTRRPKLM